MYTAFIIVIREALEAAFVIGIVMAATAGVQGSRRMIVTGLAAGVAGAAAVAYSADVISTALAGMGQELFNATVLLTAVGLLAWHQAWMQRHGADMARELRSVGNAVTTGARPLTAIAIVVALAVLREGAEVALFLYGTAAGGASSSQVLVGGLMGLAAGASIGALLYLGLLRIPGRRLFQVTGWLLTGVAAGMAAQAGGLLVQAGWLPPLVEPVWDSAAWLPVSGAAGQVLHALLGYDDRPAAMQLVFFAVTLATMLLLGGQVRLRRPSGRPVATSAMLVALVLFLPAPAARADHKVYSPIVEEGEIALELRGHREFDPDQARDGAQKYKLDLEYAPASRWLTEVVAEWERETGDSLRATEVAWENVFQLTEQGRYALDAGLLVEYAHSLERGGQDKLEVGALLQKEFGRSIMLLNLLAEHELGSDSRTELEYALQYRWRHHPRFEPGIEFYGEFGEVGRFGSLADHGHEAGPAVFGRLPLSSGALKYEAALLFGLTHEAAARTLRFLVEYEF